MRKQLKKFAGILLSSAFLVTAFASCGGTAGNDPSKGDDDANATYYTVTLDPNGGAFADGTSETKTIQVKEKGKINFADYDVTWEGNEMYGWYYADGTPFPAARKITENIVIKAKWSAAEIKEEIGLTLRDYLNNEISCDYDDGVYQFFKNSPIHGGYAQRGGKYTVYEEELKAALEENKNSEKAVCVYTIKGSYKDSTGGCYAEAFNDGTMELIYDFTNGGERTKYTMEVLAYTLKGVTMPFSSPALPDISGKATDDEGNINYNALASKSVHYKDNDEALKGGPGSLEDPFAGDEEEKALGLSEKVDTSSDESILVRYGANNGSKTMFLQFNVDQTFAVLFDTTAYGQAGFHTTGKGTWTIENGQMKTEGYGEVSVAEGVVTFDDKGGNTFAFLLTDFVPALSEIVDTSDDDTIVLRVGANNGSKTMFLQFNRDGKYTVKMNYGNYGLVEVGKKGTWKIEEGKLVMTGDGEMKEQFGVYEYADGNGNTYGFVLFEAE